MTRRRSKLITDLWIACGRSCFWRSLKLVFSIKDSCHCRVVPPLCPLPCDIVTQLQVAGRSIIFCFRLHGFFLRGLCVFLVTPMRRCPRQRPRLESRVRSNKKEAPHIRRQMPIIHSMESKFSTERCFGIRCVVS